MFQQWHVDSKEDNTVKHRNNFASQCSIKIADLKGKGGGYCKPTACDIMFFL